MGYAHYNFAVLDFDNMTVVHGATITVRREISGLPLAPLKSDRAGSLKLNPYVAADGGDAGFYAVPGHYRVTATKGAFTRTWENVPLVDPDAQPSAASEFKGLFYVREGDYLYVRSKFSPTQDLVEVFFLGDEGIETVSGCAGPYGARLIPFDTLEGATALTAQTAYDNFATTGDDASPTWINEWPQGGNHGPPCKIVDMVAHGKTNVDIGSRWTDGAAKSWIIGGIVSANQLLIVELPGGTATSWTFTTILTGSTLTHAAGATHTAAINFTNPVASQMWPFIQRQTVRVVIDGEIEVDADGSGNAGLVKLSQTYGIPNARSMIDDLISDVGSTADPVYNDTTTQTQVEIGITFSWRPGEAMRVDHEKFNVQSYSSHLAALQASPIEVGSDKLYLQIPRSTTEATTGLNYDTPQDMTAVATTFELGTAEWATASDPPAEFSFIRKTAGGVPVRGFTMGLCHLVGEGVPTQRALDVASALQHSAPHKVYLWTVDTNLGATSPANDYRKWTGYRAFFDGTVDPDIRVIVYTLDDGRKFMVLRTEATLTNRWVKPPYGCHANLIGRGIRTTGNGKKSSSLTLSSEFITERGVLISTTAGGGWMIAEIGAAGSSLPFTTRGDLMVRGADLPQRLAIGAANTVLKSNGTDPAWVAAPEALTANRTYYVRSDGSNSNTGLVNSAGGAFLTGQKALDVATTLDLGTFNVTIQFVNVTTPQTYTGTMSQLVPFRSAGGTVTIQGDVTTPSNLVISTGSSNAITANGSGVTLNVNGIKFLTTSGSCILSQFGARINVTGKVEFGAVGTAFNASYGGTISVNAGTYVISGNANYHMFAASSGRIVNDNNTVTISGSPAITTFAYASGSGYIESNNTWSGSATGIKFTTNSAGGINTFGAGISYLPGGTAGTATSPGWYV